jgi:hypothetical protein
MIACAPVITAQPYPASSLAATATIESPAQRQADERSGMNAIAVDVRRSAGRMSAGKWRIVLLSDE